MNIGQVLGSRQHGRRGLAGSRPLPIPRRQRVRRQPHEDGGVVEVSRLDDVLTSELEAELQPISDERKWSQRIEECFDSGGGPAASISELDELGSAANPGGLVGSFLRGYHRQVSWDRMHRSCQPPRAQTQPQTR
jgi:hypothetical protein